MRRPAAAARRMTRLRALRGDSTYDVLREGGCGQRNKEYPKCSKKFQTSCIESPQASSLQISGLSEWGFRKLFVHEYMISGGMFWRDVSRAAMP